MNKSKTIKGISIIESLVCIVIIGIGFIAIMQLSAFSIVSMDRAIEKNKVNFLTEMMMEDMVADPDQIKEYSKFTERCSYNPTNGSNIYEKQKDKWRKRIKYENQIKISNKYKTPRCNNKDIKQVFTDNAGEKARIKFFTNKGKSKKYLGLVIK
jgi:type II secretory pathway pseudopilin PulG